MKNTRILTGNERLQAIKAIGERAKAARSAKMNKGNSYD
jgi:hypothetical protein